MKLRKPSSVNVFAIFKMPKVSLPLLLINLFQHMPFDEKKLQKVIHFLFLLKGLIIFTFVLGSDNGL